MTGVYDFFQIITELGPGHFIQTNIDSPQIAIRGVGTVKFQLDLSEILEIHGVLFVPGMRVSKLSVSSFKDEGYGLMLRSSNVVLYRRYEPIRTTILLGDCKDMLLYRTIHPCNLGSGVTNLLIDLQRISFYRK